MAGRRLPSLSVPYDYLIDRAAVAPQALGRLGRGRHRSGGGGIGRQTARVLVHLGAHVAVFAIAVQHCSTPTVPARLT